MAVPGRCTIIWKGGRVAVGLWPSCFYVLLIIYTIHQKSRESANGEQMTNILCSDYNLNATGVIILHVSNLCSINVPRGILYDKRVASRRLLPYHVEVNTICHTNSWEFRAVHDDDVFLQPHFSLSVNSCRRKGPSSVQATELFTSGRELSREHQNIPRRCCTSATQVSVQGTLPNNSFVVQEPLCGTKFFQKKRLYSTCPGERWFPKGVTARPFQGSMCGEGGSGKRKGYPWKEVVADE